MTEKLITVGYFSYDCQPDGWCTYGCGKTPEVVCVRCSDTPMPSNWHALKERDDYDWPSNGFCDKCAEAFYWKH